MFICSIDPAKLMLKGIPRRVSLGSALRLPSAKTSLPTKKKNGKKDKNDEQNTGVPYTHDLSMVERGCHLPSSTAYVKQWQIELNNNESPQRVMNSLFWRCEQLRRLQMESGRYLSSDESSGSDKWSQGGTYQARRARDGRVPTLRFVAVSCAPRVGATKIHPTTATPTP